MFYRVKSISIEKQTFPIAKKKKDLCNFGCIFLIRILENPNFLRSFPKKYKN